MNCNKRSGIHIRATSEGLFLGAQTERGPLAQLGWLKQPLQTPPPAHVHVLGDIQAQQVVFTPPPPMNCSLLFLIVVLSVS